MREHLREGSARQAIVTADLLRRGFEVFQEVGNSSFDLVAHKHGFLVKIEVKGLERHKKNPPYGPVGAIAGHNNAVADRFDVLATVTDKVQYNPSVFLRPNEASLELTKGHDEYSSRTTKKHLDRAAALAQEAR